MVGAGLALSGSLYPLQYVELVLGRGATPHCLDGYRLKAAVPAGTQCLANLRDSPLPTACIPCLSRLFKVQAAQSSGHYTFTKTGLFNSQVCRVLHTDDG